MAGASWPRITTLRVDWAGPSCPPWSAWRDRCGSSTSPCMACRVRHRRRAARMGRHRRRRHRLRSPPSRDGLRRWVRTAQHQTPLATHDRLRRPGLCCTDVVDTARQSDGHSECDRTVVEWTLGMDVVYYAARTASARCRRCWGIGRVCDCRGDAPPSTWSGWCLNRSCTDTGGCLVGTLLRAVRRCVRLWPGAVSTRLQAFHLCKGTSMRSRSWST